MTKKFTLGKTERLKSRKAIEELFEKGKGFSISPFRVAYLRTEATGLRVAVGASTKNFKKAVDRNRIKRLMREAYRLQKIPLQKFLQSQNKGISLFLTYTGKEIPDYAIVSGTVQKCLNKLLNLVSENNTPHT
ncbi:MAG: ribonuclease P protein component [Bacteroidota bacterium]